MKITELRIPGLHLIELHPYIDERGSFTRTYCRSTFRNHQLQECAAQCSTSHNKHRATLRGLHFQHAPHTETKVVRCSRGAIWDVAVDLRKDSRCYGDWLAVNLTADNGLSLYIPKGFAHGFLTLCDDTEVVYQMDEPYAPSAGGGIRWDDADLSISWPMEPIFISAKDAELPFLADQRPL